MCAGSGDSVLSGVEADLYLTGEMSHHHILEAVSFGRTVIVCNHSNTERGYLKEIKCELDRQLDDDYEVIISKMDHDPLTIHSCVCSNNQATQHKQINLYDVFFFLLHRLLY